MMSSRIKNIEHRRKRGQSIGGGRRLVINIIKMLVRSSPCSLIGAGFWGRALSVPKFTPMILNPEVSRERHEIDLSLSEEKSTSAIVLHGVQCGGSEWLMRRLLAALIAR